MDATKPLSAHPAKELPDYTDDSLFDRDRATTGDSAGITRARVLRTAQHRAAGAPARIAAAIAMAAVADACRRLMPEDPTP